jgi:predicted kinase
VRFLHAQSYFAAPPHRSGETRFLSVPGERGNRAPEPRAPRQVLLVLVGLPGSGKTTAALQMANWEPPGSWVRVSQDQLRSRARCLRLAASALGAGSSVVVDRTNLTAEQRALWVTLAAEHRVPCHCVEFLVSLEVCAERAAQRSEHEGGVTGARGRRVTMVATAGRQPVGSAEGFAAYAAVGGDPGGPEAARVLHALYGGPAPHPAREARVAHPALPAHPRGAAGAPQ